MQIKTELTQWQQDKLYHWLDRWDDFGPYMQALYKRAPVEAPFFNGHWFDNGGTWRLFGGEWLACPRAAMRPPYPGFLEFGVSLDNAQYVEQWNTQRHALLAGEWEIVRGLSQWLEKFPTLALCLENHFLVCPITQETEKSELIEKYWRAKQANDSCDFANFLFAHAFFAFDGHIYEEIHGRICSVLDVLVFIENLLRTCGTLTIDVLRDLVILRCNSEFCRSHNQLDRDGAASDTNKRLQTNFVTTLLHAFRESSVLNVRNNRVSLNKVPFSTSNRYAK